LCLLKKTEHERWYSKTNTWWFPSSYNAWDSEPDESKWLRSSEDLLAIESLIEVTNPKDHSQWLVLEAFYQWKQPIPPGEEYLDLPYRDIWYMLKSYIVKKSHRDELFEWAKQQDFTNYPVPESEELTHVFLGEFFWSPAFEYHNIPYYCHQGWTRGIDDRIPKEVLVSTDQYMWEHGIYDCSIDDTISIYLPAKWLLDYMDLSWNGIEGQFFNRKRELIAFDPSIQIPGPGALLIHKEVFLKFLDDNGYDILWMVRGEKNFDGGRMLHEEWKGRLEINGAYRIYKNKIDGAIHTKFLSRA
jgi:hypothetical protein